MVPFVINVLIVHTKFGQLSSYLKNYINSWWIQNVYMHFSSFIFCSKGWNYFNFYKHIL